MGGTVSPDQAGAVQREKHRQVLQRHVMDQLVVAALQKGRIDRHHRLQTLAGQAGGKGHGMLFSDAHVVVARRKPLFKLDQARAFAHGRGDAHQALVGRGHVAYPLPEDLGEGGLGRRGRLGQANRRVELGRPVVVDRVGLGQLVAKALFGHHMQELRALAVTQVFQCRDQRVQVMAIDRADIGEAQFLEDRARRNHALGVLFKAPREFIQRRVAQHALRALASGGVGAAAEQAGQVLVQRAYRGADRHVVVVEHHQQVGRPHAMRAAAVVERLEGHATGERAVTDHRHRAAVFALQFGGMGHAQRGRNRGR